MTGVLKSVLKVLRTFGLDPVKFFRSIRGIPFYIDNLMKMKKQKGDDTSFPFGRKYPILDERFLESGTMSGHYFHQDLYIAQKIFKENPERHLDIGSRTDGFVAHVAVFREIEVADIREQISKVPNIVFKRADLMKLPEEMTAHYDSVSALHSIEHFGLGRYGDPVDYYGHLKAIENITHLLKPNGKFYFSAPIGWQRIEFNAHRVFSLQYLLDIFRKDFFVNSFSYVDDLGDFHKNAELSEINIQSNFSCTYGCGIFELTKKP